MKLRYSETVGKMGPVTFFGSKGDQWSVFQLCHYLLDIFILNFIFIKIKVNRFWLSCLINPLDLLSFKNLSII